MKKIVSLVILGSALALTACGGDSDSSGSSSDKKDKADTSASTAPAGSNAGSDTDSANDLIPCSVDGNTITGTVGKTCQYAPGNVDVDMKITCDSKMTLNGNVGSFASQDSTFSSGSNINGYIFQCS